MRHALRPVVPVAARQFGQRQAEDVFRAAVEGFQTACFVERDYAGGQAFQYGFEIVACRFLPDAVELFGFAGDGQLFGHVVEQACQLAEFVVAVNRSGLGKIALCDGFRAFGKREDGFDEAAGKVEGDDQREHDGEQGGGQQGNQEEGLQALFGVGEFGVFAARVFNQFGIPRDVVGNRPSEKQGFPFFLRRGQGQPALGVQFAVDVGDAAG